MRKHYDSMDAYKVTFNANEQVAAACTAYDAGTKYQIPELGQSVCNLSEDGTKYTGFGFSDCFFTDAGSQPMDIATKYQS